VTKRWGITVPLSADRGVADQLSIYRRLARLGYTDVWTAEGGGAGDGFTPLAVAAAEPSLRLGVGVVSSFTRGPAILAGTAAAMANLAPGRFTLGIGSSSDVIVQRWNGIAFQRPYSRTRDVVRFLKAAFRGERVTADYETFSIRGFSLGTPLDSPPSILVAGLRERMLRLAGAEADGAMLNFTSAEDVVKLAAIVRGENPEAEVVDRIMVCPTEDSEAVYQAVKPVLASYTVVGVYRAYHEWLGRAPLLEDAWAAWDAGDRAAAITAIPDKVVDDLCIHGSPEACRAKLNRYVENGVTTPVIALMTTARGDIESAIEALAPQ
jgi:probable F420-dependent oxidoreductase